MGLFDLFSKKTASDSKSKEVSPRELARLTRLVSNKMSQNYERQEAIEQLSQMANAAGASALLRRFDFSMEPSIVDQDEKEAAVQGIVAAGQAALDPIHSYCARAESLNWPLKVLRQIVPNEQMVQELLTLLDLFDTEYMRNPEPKIQLISMLGEYKTPEVREAVEPFLSDVNESVRFHAAGTIFAMADAEALQPLIEALAQEESLRVKNRVARGLEQAAWEIPAELTERCEHALPPGYAIRSGKVVGVVV
jgi:HEAT repeat protein